MTFMRKLLDALNMDNWGDNKDIVYKEEGYDCIRHNRPCEVRIDNSKHIIPDSLCRKYNGTLPKRKEEIIARDILSTVGVCTSSHLKLCNEALEYLSHNHSRIEICVYGAEICIPPRNNNELYLISCGYRYAGASYRKEAICWSEKYIEGGAVSDYIQSHILCSNNYSYDQRIKFVALAHSSLAGLYAEENMIDKSNNEYRTSISIAPFLSSTYIKMARNFIKQREFTEVENIMTEAQNTLWYSIDDSFKENIDNHIIEFNGEISTIKYYLDVVIPSALKIITDSPGILQKDLYDAFPNLDPLHIRWACKNLSQEGKIIRQKKGNSYALYIGNELTNK